MVYLRKLYIRVSKLSVSSKNRAPRFRDTFLWKVKSNPSMKDETLLTLLKVGVATKYSTVQCYQYTSELMPLNTDHTPEISQLEAGGPFIVWSSQKLASTLGSWPSLKLSILFQKFTMQWRYYGFNTDFCLWMWPRWSSSAEVARPVHKISSEVRWGHLYHMGDGSRYAT